MTGKQFSSVWARDPRPAKSPGRSREEIVRAAVELLDAEGLDGLSMRKLGAKLDAGATSLYWYVANKRELLELVYDEIWGEMTVPPPEETKWWRQTAGAFAHSMRRVILRHPWSAGLIGRTPALGPNALEVTSRLTRAFKDAGFRGLEIDYAASTLTAFVFGTTIPEVAYNEAMARDPLDEDSMREAVERAAAAHPDLLERMRESKPADLRESREMMFTFGLAAVLDGLEARLTA
ncbi:TetR/AcrR family transcriptional regulator C-terminal domain-containing protein [Nonomuraea sp. C10]|uniref:TetR/AcrR family transcriptional regulator C-terminal domain-containing protein n=1 Tax=Nonomuraea sp. C10 TaxID=2600577 RepID=UPI0011CE8180|nr:TetR/AcrR family transcriptional regulator C-terminal domain-containing protein [Nonomuraea sp. C10]TXK42910.1 TetR family transcriptional regulator [Nonomuraea sp. C10]